jgi:hypothetical protein
VVVVATASPVSASSSSHSKSLTVSPLVVEPSCPAASLVNAHLGTHVSSFGDQRLGGIAQSTQCGYEGFQIESGKAVSESATIEIVPQSTSSATHFLLCSATVPCKLIPVKVPGTSGSSYWKYKYPNVNGPASTEIGVRIVEHGWLVYTYSFDTPGGLQAVVTKLASLTEALTLPTAP